MGGVAQSGDSAALVVVAVLTAVVSLRSLIAPGTWFAVSVVGVVLLELLWLRTGIFRTLQYWVSILIVFAFQIPVDGWLTKLSDPIVIYNPREMSGLRTPWDIPVEDFGFGFAMVTLTLASWAAVNRRANTARRRGRDTRTRRSSTR